MASTYLTRTPSSSGNRKTFTLSLWMKRSSTNYETFAGTGTGSTYLMFNFSSSQPRFFQSANAGESVEVQVNNKLRDCNAWYHLVFRVDTTQSTASDRVRIYINGEEATYAVTTYPSQDSNMYYNYNISHGLGARADGDADFDGCMSHVHFCDGYSYAPTEFGETDSTTGEWKIKTSPSVSYGTNGYFIFKNGNNLSGSTVQDQSGQGNNFTVAGGTLTNTEDCPSNVFATFNPLCIRTQILGSSTFSYTNGNNTHSNTDPSYSTYNVSTLGMQGSGKYYCEFKLNTLGGSSDSERFGISNLNNFSNYPFGSSSGYSYNKDGNATPSGSGFPTYTTNDIIGVAFDAGNGNLWFSKNGTWINNATISEIGAGTTTNAVFTGISTSETWHFSGATYSNGSISANFGNGYFGTTAISSEGTNASGIGIFEYDVPTGFTALSTKGLNL